MLTIKTSIFKFRLWSRYQDNIIKCRTVHCSAQLHDCIINKRRSHLCQHWDRM